MIAAVRSALVALANPEGRRAWALVFLAGGGVTMTIYAAYAMYLVRHRAGYVFQLGLAAHLTILIVITGFAGLLVKRSIVAQFGANRRFEVSDRDVAAAAAEEVAEAATDKASEIKDQPL